MENKKEKIYIGPFCPCCGTGAHGLEIIAKMFTQVSQALNTDATDIEKDLNKWAQNIRDIHYTKPSILQ